jgi:hypothetical protein
MMIIAMLKFVLVGTTIPQLQERSFAEAVTGRVRCCGVEKGRQKSAVRANFYQFWCEEEYQSSVLRWVLFWVIF